MVTLKIYLLEVMKKYTLPFGDIFEFESFEGSHFREAGPFVIF